MTPNSSRIPIPLRQRLRRARYRIVPLLTFGLAVAATMLLWGRQTSAPNAFGAVESVRYDVTSTVAGLLVSDSVQPLDLFTEVTKGQILARLDDSIIKQSLAALRGDLAAAQKELAATEAQTRLEEATLLQDRVIELRRLALNMEAIRLDLLDRQAELETEKINLQLLEEQYAMAKTMKEKNAETEFGLLSYKLLRDVAFQRVTGLEKTVKEATLQYANAETRLKNLPEFAQVSLDTLLAPLRETAAAAEARMRELEEQAKQLVIRAPANGTITALYKRPGQNVAAGEPILTLVDSAPPRRILSYIRADQRISPKPGMAVIIRSRVDPTRTIESHVVDVGSQVEPVSPRHLRNPTIPEWGVLMGVAVPPDAQLLPGEIVDLTLRR